MQAHQLAVIIISGKLMFILIIISSDIECNHCKVVIKTYDEYIQHKKDCFTICRHGCGKVFSRSGNASRHEEDCVLRAKKQAV